MKLISRGSVLGLVAAAVLMAQTPGLQRNVVQRGDISVPGREAVIVHVEFANGVSTGKHTHPGEEISYVEAGEGELTIDGQPTRKLNVGDGFIVPAGRKHEARNTGTGTLKIVAVYLVEKGKPLATPVP
jgi:quercetin dioxygenase-like cupin family protein